jgi:hypothetical protein
MVVKARPRPLDITFSDPWTLPRTEVQAAEESSAFISLRGPKVLAARSDTLTVEMFGLTVCAQVGEFRALCDLNVRSRLFGWTSPLLPCSQDERSRLGPNLSL